MLRLVSDQLQNVSEKKLTLQQKIDSLQERISQVRKRGEVFDRALIAKRGEKQLLDIRVVQCHEAFDEMPKRREEIGRLCLELQRRPSEAVVQSAKTLFSQVTAQGSQVDTRWRLAISAEDKMLRDLVHNQPNQHTLDFVTSGEYAKAMAGRR
jgi:hypothetical protein